MHTCVSCDVIANMYVRTYIRIWCIGSASELGGTDDGSKGMREDVRCMYIVYDIRM